MLRMSTRWTESGRPQGRPLRWTDGRAQCGAIGTSVGYLNQSPAISAEIVTSDPLRDSYLPLDSVGFVSGW